MSGTGRYSLRATPRKKELYEGMVETPGRRTSSRRRTPLNGIDDASDGGESSSAAETVPKKKTVTRRRTGKFIEDIDDSDLGHDTTLESVEEDKPVSHANGNGHAANGVKASAPEKKSDDKVDMTKLVDSWAPGLDHKIDYSPHFEFGGSFGALALMMGFPALMYYMWIGATYYDGKLPLPTEGQSMSEFFNHLGNLVYTGAFPTLQAWKIYWVYYVFEAVLYLVAPGVYGYGKPLVFDNDRQLKYFCNAYASFYITIATMAALHFSGWFKINTFIDEFGPIMSVGIISGFLCSFVAYFSALARGAQHRMTGYPIYDFFMGAELNPRMFGILDFKMFYEVRIPWYILFGISAAGAARQYENYGYVTGEMCFLLMAHYLYANACSKGEQLIISSWDMYYEKWGFMLIFWNMAGVPLSYCHCTLYLANHDPSEYAWNKWALGVLFVLYLGFYVIWDQANGQKNAFRAMERGKLVKRYTFPALPWIYIDNPKVIPTSTGDSLLADGWWGYARKIHYTCDVFFAVSWGLITGFNSPFPWFYPFFFVCMIIHRATRDIQRCRIKYGEAWAEYERQVPYLFIPYVI